MSIITSSGYAPHVPSEIDLSEADKETLILVIRDTLQNGASATRANLALSLLLSKLQLPTQETRLDPWPWASYTSDARRFKTRASVPADVDVVFKPHFGYAQNQEDYR